MRHKHWLVSMMMSVMGMCYIPIKATERPSSSTRR